MSTSMLWMLKLPSPWKNSHRLGQEPAKDPFSPPRSQGEGIEQQAITPHVWWGEMLLVLYIKLPASCLQQGGVHSSPQCLPGCGVKPLSAEGLWLRCKGSRHRQPQPSTARRRRAGERPSCAQRPAAHSPGPCTSSAASSSPGTCQGAAGHLQRREYCKLLVSVSHPKGRNMLSPS